MPSPPSMARSVCRPPSVRMLAAAFVVALGLTSCDSRVRLGLLPPSADGGVGDDGGAAAAWPWRATFESGDWDEWSTFSAGINGGDRFNSQSKGMVMPLPAPLNVPPPGAPSGAAAEVNTKTAMLTLGPLTGDSVQEARFFRYGPFPKKARFGFWLYFPTGYAISTYWNVMQLFAPGQVWPASGLLWDVDLYPGLGGDPNMYFGLFDHVDLDKSPTGVTVRSSSPRALVPIMDWVHVEVIYAQATSPTGSIELLIDGTSILKQDNVVTAYDDNLEVFIGSFAQYKITPTPVVYLDDVTIAPEP